MRTTLTLDEDVESRVREHVRKTGVSFKEAINDLIRRGLLDAENPKQLPRFKVRPLPMSGLREGLSYDDIEELLDQLDGPYRR